MFQIELILKKVMGYPANRFVLLVFVLMGGIVSIIYWVPTAETPKMGLVVDFISALTGLVTVFLALLLFNKFGVEALVVEKKFKLVSDLLTEIAKKRYTIHSLTKSPEFPRIDFFHPRYSEAYVNNNENKERILIGRSYVDGISRIEGLAKDFFMPSEVQDKIKPLLIKHIDQGKGISADSYYEQGYAYVEDDSSSSSPENDDMIGKLNSREIGVVEFARYWQEIVDEASKWINKNSSIKVEIRPN